MKKILAICLLLITQVASASSIKVELLLNDHLGIINDDQIYIAKIDGMTAISECTITDENRTKCTFRRSNVDTYNGLNVLIALKNLTQEANLYSDHGTLSLIIDGVVYEQRSFKLDMKSKRGSIGDIAGLGIININF